MTCIYDYSGRANVMELRIHLIETHIPICESYAATRSVLRVCIRMRIFYGYTHVALWDSSLW